MHTAAPNVFDLLLPYQRRWVLDASRLKLWLKSRQIGGSFACAFETVADALSRQTEWLILSAGERQAHAFMEKVHRVATVFADALRRASGKPVPFTSKASELRFDNGSVIRALPAKPETVRGYSANLVLDEFAFHERPDAIWEAIAPSVTNPLKGELKVRVISTPAGRNNKFFELWEKGSNWSRHRSTIHDAVADGLDVKVPELRALIGDSESWAQEFECEFVDAANVLLPYELIDACAHPEASLEGSDTPTAGPLYVGIDIGRKRDLTVCWTLERVGDVLWTREVLVMADTPYHIQEEALAARIARARIAAIDETGIGNALSESLARTFEHKLQRHTFTAPFKQMIFPALRRAFQERRLRIPADSAVREDLHSVNEVTTPGGQKLYRALRSVDGHADRCTALALALHSAGQRSEAVESTDGILIGRGRVNPVRGERMACR